MSKQSTVFNIQTGSGGCCSDRDVPRACIRDLLQGNTLNGSSSNAVKFADAPFSQNLQSCPKGAICYVGCSTLQLSRAGCSTLTMERVFSLCCTFSAILCCFQGNCRHLNSLTEAMGLQSSSSSPLPTPRVPLFPWRQDSCCLCSCFPAE